eukprot:2178618-Pyramimonas_sp.AAC.1
MGAATPWVGTLTLGRSVDVLVTCGATSRVKACQNRRGGKMPREGRADMGAATLCAPSHKGLRWATTR